MKSTLGFAGWAVLASAALAAPVVMDPHLAIQKVMDTGTGSIRLVRNPADQHLYYLKQSGQIYRVDPALPPAASTSTLVFGSADHQVTSAAGLAIASDGTFFVSSNRNASNFTISAITKGVRDSTTGVRRWSVLAETAPYESQSRIFNHRMNALALSPDEQSILVNIGARTDHGEVQSDGTRFPGVREVGLTAVILELPVSGNGLILPNDRELLRTMGYLYSEGVRNTFDLAFAANGDLFGVENGPDRDMPEELNWLRRGHHYGFPWRMGTEDNPQQFGFYEPATDLLLNPGFAAVNRGMWANDPTFPPPPPGRTFTDPIPNIGPDADRFRDARTGQIMDASDLGLTLGSFTAHRSPLGLSFDNKRAFGKQYSGDAFVLSWTPGVAAGQEGTGPFGDSSEDLLHLKLQRDVKGYQVAATTIAAGFRNPVATTIANNKLYVLENGGTQSIWEITFPPPPRPLLVESKLLANGDFELTVHGAEGHSYLLESSGDMAKWNPVRTYRGSETPLVLSFPVINKARQFFRASMVSEP